MPASSFARRSMRVRGTPQVFANAPGDRPSGIRNSSRRTSPGCMGGSFFGIFVSRFQLVIINEFNLCRTLYSPDKTDAELVVDSNRVLTFSIGFQSLKTISGW